jgi:hypothetical protein
MVRIEHTGGFRPELGLKPLETEKIEEHANAKQAEPQQGDSRMH